jgi:hypothetical protein
VETSGEGFIWKAGAGANLLPQVQSGFLGWLDDYAKLEAAGKHEAALQYHTASRGGANPGDIFNYLEGMLKTVRGRGKFKTAIEQMKRDAISGDIIQKNKEMIELSRSFVKKLAWKVFRDYVANKEYAQRAFQDPKTANFLKQHLKNYLLDTENGHEVTKLMESPEAVTFSIPLAALHPHPEKLNGKRAIVTIPINGRAFQVHITPQQMAGILAEEPKGTSHVLQDVDLVKRLRAGGITGRVGKVTTSQKLEMQGYDLTGLPSDLSVVFFESGESQQIVDHLGGAFRNEALAGTTYAAEIQKGIQRHLESGNLNRILTEIAMMSKENAESAFGAPNVATVMTFIASLEPGILSQYMKDWNPEVHANLTKTFSRRGDKELYEKGNIIFHQAAHPNSIFFSKSHEGRQVFFPFLMETFAPGDLDRDRKIVFEMHDIQNIQGFQPGQKYYVRNKVNGRLYPRRHHTLQTLAAAGAWVVRIPGDMRYQILEFEPERIKAQGVRHKLNKITIVNLVDIAAERKGDVIETKLGFSKLKEKLLGIAQGGTSTLYAHAAFMPSSGSRRVHTVYNMQRHFIPLEGGRTATVHNYDVKGMTYVAEDGQEVKIRDDAGNAFSPIRDENGVPLLNPELFKPSDKPTEAERQEDYRKEFLEFNEYAAQLGVRVIYDHVFWYAPEDVNSGNYRDFFWMELSPAGLEAYRDIERRRLQYRDSPELKAFAQNYGIIPDKFDEFAEHWSQMVFSREKQAFMDGEAEAHPGFFAIPVTENGEERVVFIYHMEGANIDQALPNPASARIRQGQLNFMKFLIDHKAAGVRSDLAGRLLSYGNAGWLGDHYRRPGVLYSAPFDVDQEFWKSFIADTKRYDRTVKNMRGDASRDEFLFMMEVYGDEQREYLAKAGADLLYFKEVAEAFKSLVSGASPEAFLQALTRAFNNFTQEDLVQFVLFLSNFDEISLGQLGQKKYGTMVMDLLAASGMATMNELKPLEALHSTVGGKDPVTKVVTHTMSTPEQARQRDTWQKYSAVIDNAPELAWGKRLQSSIEVPGQRQVRTLINPEQTASGVAVQEPETGNWTLVVGHHR